MKHLWRIGLFLGGAAPLAAQAVPVTLNELQCNWDSTYASTYVGQTVEVSGVVSTPFGSVASSRTFFIQTPSGGPCSGVMVYVPSSAGTPSISLGDSVTLIGDVSEYFGNTELMVSDTTNITVHGNVGEPTPAVIAAGVLDTSATSNYFSSQPDTAEMYEGVLVEVSGVVADTNVDGQGDWTLTDGTGFVKVRVNGNYTYNPVPGDPLTVRGVVHTYFNFYRIQPRMDSDVIVQAVHVSYAYARSSDQVDVIFSTEIGASSAEDPTNYSLWDSTFTTQIPITAATQDPTNLKRVTLTLGQNLTPGAFYHLISTIPTPAETTSFYGLLTLAQIQSDTVAGDTTGTYPSQWNGQVVSVQVIVTADPTAISFSSSAWAFFQDPGGGPWSGIMTYAPGVAPSFTEGDSLLLVGEISEYNGMTEIVNLLHWELLGQNATLTVDPVATGDVGEVWEGALIQVSGTVQSVSGTSFVLDDGTGPVTVNADTTTMANIYPGGVATVTGVVRYVGGNYEIYARKDTDVGVSESQTQTTGLRLLNPVFKGSALILAAPGRTALTIQVVDILGRKVMDQRVPVVNGVARVPALRLASGVYFIRTSGQTFRFVRLR